MKERFTIEGIITEQSESPLRGGYYPIMIMDPESGGIAGLIVNKVYGEELKGTPILGEFVRAIVEEDPNVALHYRVVGRFEVLKKTQKD